MLSFPEGSERALVPAIRFYDIEEVRHRLWQAHLHPDRPIVEEHTYSFPDFLVYAVELERDGLRTRSQAAEAREHTLQQTVVGLQTQLQATRVKRDEARCAAVDAQIEVAERYYREVNLREEVEFTEGEYRSILEERGQMVTRPNHRIRL